MDRILQEPGGRVGMVVEGLVGESLGRLLPARLDRSWSRVWSRNDKACRSSAPASARRPARR
jgi:hypothetical protein